MPKTLQSLHDYDAAEHPIEVLDATASYRAWWKGKDTSKVIFVDRRKEVKPDIVCSNEFLPFVSGIFKGVFYDPPHVIAHAKDATFFKTEFGIRFSAWESRDQFVLNVIRVNRAFTRVLTDDGTLLLKHTDIDDEGLTLWHMMTLLSNFEETDREKQKSGTGHGDRPVFYITFKKKQSLVDTKIDIKDEEIKGKTQS